MAGFETDGGDANRNRPRWLVDAEQLDVAIYAAIARTPSPSIDRAMRTLSQAADHSKINLAVAVLLHKWGGDAGRRGARIGAVSVAITSIVVNAGLKQLAQRGRPDREAHMSPEIRHVSMPSTRALPSGHSAAAFAFATGVGHALPQVALPLRSLAAAVAYSRVHTGVHFPGDVVAGALAGTAVAQATAYVMDRQK